MDLSSIISGPVKPYLEYAWVCAPNTAGQALTVNTITTLTIDTEVADTGNYGSISNNQVTLSAGTYYFKARSGNTIVASGNSAGGTISLYNVTASSYVTRKEFFSATTMDNTDFEGQFTIASSSVFELRMYYYENASRTLTNGGAYWPGNSSLSTAGADQRTTIKLWKLA